MNNAIFIEMLATVHFDGEVEGGGMEVQDVVSERVLAKEAYVMYLSASKMKPERLFGVGQVAA